MTCSYNRDRFSHEIITTPKSKQYLTLDNTNGQRNRNKFYNLKNLKEIVGNSGFELINDEKDNFQIIRIWIDQLYSSRTSTENEFGILKGLYGRLENKN